MNTSDLPLPAYQTDGAACFDLLANIVEAVTIEPHQRAIIPTGIHVAIPVGYELQIRGRSGLAARHSVGVAQGIGTIDSDYRGEIQVILINHGDEPFVIKRGDRIAQSTVAPTYRVEWQLVDELDETSRGHGKFGSTGKR